MTTNNLPVEFWDEAYSIMVKYAGAVEESREYFLQQANDLTEWRFCGLLGMGGKIRYKTDRGVYIDCYREDETKTKIAIMEKCNTLLIALWEKEKA